MFATDGTAFGCDWTNKAVAAADLTEDQRDMIRTGNAMDMFGHLVSAVTSGAAAQAAE